MQPICAQYIILSHFGSYLKIVLTIAQSNYITGCSLNRALRPRTLRPQTIPYNPRPGPKLNIFTWQDFVMI